ncbi:MAG: hypothetical protein ACI8RZ_007909, partial [Myxococcota bacterium]
RQPVVTLYKSTNDCAILEAEERQHGVSWANPAMRVPLRREMR